MENRRKNGGLTDDQLIQIKAAILASIYEEIGRSIISKLLWVVGTLCLTALAWLVGSGKISLK